LRRLRADAWVFGDSAGHRLDCDDAFPIPTESKLGNRICCESKNNDVRKFGRVVESWRVGRCCGIKKEEG